MPLLSKLKALQPLWQAISPRRRRQLLALQLINIVAAVGEVANLGALLPFLRLLASPKEGLGLMGPLAAPLLSLPSEKLLLAVGLGFMLVVVVSTLLRLIAIRLQLRLGALIVAELGESVFLSVLRQPFAWHLKHNSSSVLSFLTNDVQQAQVSINAALVLLMNLSVLMLLGASLFLMAPLVMLVIAPLLGGIYLLVFRLTKATLKADGHRATASYQSSLQLAQEALGGIRDVLLDRSESYFFDAYTACTRSFLFTREAINFKTASPRYAIEGFVLLLIVGLSLSLALQGQGIEHQLPLLGALSLGAYRLLQPLQQSFVSVSNLQANLASLKRLEPFLSPTSLLPSTTKLALPLAVINPAVPLVQFSGVRFRYSPEGSWVLKDLNLEIHAGERLAIVGSTGSGKSTTSDLILGLLPPTQGQVLVAGQDLHGSAGVVEAWQRKVAHVPQHIYLSDASFAANIAFGIPEEWIDLKRVQQAARQARIAEVIEKSSEGYDTLVGERGVRLSGGQRQRIGIARALYKRAALLVLDEATSALDNRTEFEVMEAIQDLSSTLTLIMIAHRLSTVRGCDRVVCLEQGIITGIGSYSELLQTNSSFQALVHAATRQECS
ncbi:MAG: ABC transporter ATP-binding protein [Cyanobacteriota bacterium]|jgi:ABC-type multidrug transport system fused ATPase/permease subunit